MAGIQGARLEEFASYNGQGQGTLQGSRTTVSYKVRRCCYTTTGTRVLTSTLCCGALLLTPQVFKSAARATPSSLHGDRLTRTSLAVVVDLPDAVGYTVTSVFVDSDTRLVVCS